MLLSEQIQKKKTLHITSSFSGTSGDTIKPKNRPITGLQKQEVSFSVSFLCCTRWLAVSEWLTDGVTPVRTGSHPIDLIRWSHRHTPVRVRTRTHCDWLRLITWCQNKLIGKERFLRLMWPMTGENRKKPEVVIEVKDLNIFKHLLSITVVHTFKLSEFWKTFNLQLCCEKPWVHAHGFMSEANVSKNILCISVLHLFVMQLCFMRGSLVRLEAFGQILHDAHEFLIFQRWTVRPGQGKMSRHHLPI